MCAMCWKAWAVGDHPREENMCRFPKMGVPKIHGKSFFNWMIYRVPIVQESTMSVNLEVPCIQTSSKIMINMSKGTWEMVDGCLTVISRTLNLIYHANFGI